MVTEGVTLMEEAITTEGAIMTGGDTMADEKPGRKNPNLIKSIQCSLQRNRPNKKSRIRMPAPAL
jgi:hypothetical protein